MDKDIKEGSEARPEPLMRSTESETREEEKLPNTWQIKPSLMTCHISLCMLLKVTQSCRGDSVKSCFCRDIQSRWGFIWHTSGWCGAFWVGVWLKSWYSVGGHGDCNQGNYNKKFATAHTSALGEEKRSIFGFTVFLEAKERWESLRKHVPGAFFFEVTQILKTEKSEMLTF